MKGLPIDINLASKEKLETLPLIGPKRSARIVRYRRVHGFFRNIDELALIPSIGEGIVAKLRGLATA